MKFKLFFIILVFSFSILSCGSKNKIIVSDILDKQYDLSKSKKEKLLIITDDEVCHDCVMNLDAFLTEKLNLSKYDYFVLYKDPKSIFARRAGLETYRNQYTPNAQKIFFVTENSKLQKALNIPIEIFKQTTPYLIYIDKNNKVKYFAFNQIFLSRSVIRDNFKIK